METEQKITVESPCIGGCELEKDKEVCAGCHRTLTEIAAWSRLTETEKSLVLAAVRQKQAVQERGAAVPQAP